MKVEIEELEDGIFLLMRYESLDAPFPSSDHVCMSIDEAYDECDQVYGIGREDWLQR